MDSVRPLDADEPAAAGRYRLLGRLGAGGMGRVRLGRSTGGRTVAVKTVHPHFAPDEELRARFRREIEAALRAGGVWTAPSWTPTPTPGCRGSPPPVRRARPSRRRSRTAAPCPPTPHGRWARGPGEAPAAVPETRRH